MKLLKDRFDTLSGCYYRDCDDYFSIGNFHSIQHEGLAAFV